VNDLIKTIKALEELILASSGSEAFEEILKIIYARVYAEKYKINNQSFEILFSRAKKEWPGVFRETDKIELPDNCLMLCGKVLENTFLNNTDLEIVDVAFEHLFPKTAKGSKGQFFTPRHIIDEVIRTLSPGKDEYFLDPACGSGGFLLHVMRYGLNGKQVSGIDFDNRMVKIAKASCLISNFENINIYNANALGGIKGIEDNSFDIIATNPPFGGEVKDENILRNFELPNSRHILFIEKIVKLLKPGGRAAIVVPQGILNNTNLTHVREWIFKKARVVGVVGLDNNTFKPHTNVKTSLLFIQKWKEVPPDDYPVFMAVSSKSGKNMSGEYVVRIEKGEQIIDFDLPEITNRFRRFVESEKLWEV
jgi:type I restriction enzyme M protein